MAIAARPAVTIPSAGEFYARSVSEKVAAIQARDGQLAAFFAEGIMACGGQMPLPAEYLKRAYRACA